MTCFYFAYGSNMNPQRMAARGMRMLAAQAAALSDWQLCFNKRCPITDGTAYANIVEVEGATVHGVLYTLQDEAEIRRMDPYENWPERYRREQLQVRVGSAESVSTWVYIANPDWQRDGLLPQRWYLNHLLSGRPWLPHGYYQQLAATPCF